MSPRHALAYKLVEPAAPRLGFIGTGDIGRSRMEALKEANIAHFHSVYDPSLDAAKTAATFAGGIAIAETIDELLASDIDGVVIATPNAMHAEQCIKALNSGKSVFCQKPLARNVVETRRIIQAARAANRLLSVDFSYRHLAGMERARKLLASGELGEIFAADLIFHSAYGPDKPWFYDMNAAGGGCVMDLGTHLIDLMLWLLGNDETSQVTSDLFRRGKKLSAPHKTVEDYATANFVVGQTQTRLCCSWNLHAGRDAEISVNLYGTHGGISIGNVKGSLDNFETFHLKGASRHRLGGYPDAWNGRALIEWVKELQYKPLYDSRVEQVIKVADVIDKIYRR